jgi:two-component system CheB/CheR fusion protein
MAVLIVQHLHPDHESALVDLLSGHTKMQVSEAVSAEKIEPGHVYIIPPGRQLSVANGCLKVEPFTSGTRPRLPFDHLLISMAADQHRLASLRQGDYKEELVKTAPFRPTLHADTSKENAAGETTEPVR